MGNVKLLRPAGIRRFLEASDGIDFSGSERCGVYQWIQETLQRYPYSRQSKEARGVLREFIIKMTGVSVPQVTRLMGDTCTPARWYARTSATNGCRPSHAGEVHAFYQESSLRT